MLAFKACMHASRVLCWYGEPNLTDSYQPVDASYGKLCRELALGPQFGLEHWLWLKKRNRRMWEGKKGKVDAQLRQRMALRWVGKGLGPHSCGASPRRPKPSSALQRVGEDRLPYHGGRLRRYRDLASRLDGLGFAVALRRPGPP